MPWALAIYQDLHHNGYDVFFDYLSIDSGNFEKVILENIRSRAHFLVILTPTALERCNEPNDWFRREIETAMNEKRNIIPVMTDGFDFSSQFAKDALKGKLASLSSYNGLRLYAEYFFEAMEKLRHRYLNVSLEEIYLHPFRKDASDSSRNPTSGSKQSQCNRYKSIKGTGNTWGQLCASLLRIPILGPIAAGLPLPRL